MTPSTKNRAMAPRAQDLSSDQNQLAKKIPMPFMMLTPSLPLTFSGGACLILPDVFIVAGFRFFYSGVSVHFEDDHSERQKINLQEPNVTHEQTNKTKQTTERTKGLMNFWMIPVW